MTRLKSFIFNIIAIFCLSAFTLLLLEIGARMFVGVKRPQMIVEKESSAQLDKKLKYGKPFFEGVLMCAEYTTTIKTNSEGFRDTEHELSKPKGVFRILIAGDSSTFGIGVEANQTYPKILERILNNENRRKSLRYEVFNIGLAGIGTLEEAEVIAYAMRYSPDLVLLGFLVENRWNDNGNDLWDNFKTWNINMGEKRKTSTDVKPKINIINYLNSMYNFLITNSDLFFLIMTKKGTLLRTNFIKFREDKNPNELDTSWDITKNALKKISTLVKKKDARFMIARIPFLFDVFSQGEDTVGEILTEFGKENSIYICDLLHVFRKNRNNDLYYPADGHWKPLAHSFAAREIYGCLLKNNFLDYK